MFSSNNKRQSKSSRLHYLTKLNEKPLVIVSVLGWLFFILGIIFALTSCTKEDEFFHVKLLHNQHIILVESNGYQPQLGDSLIIEAINKTTYRVYGTYSHLHLIPPNSVVQQWTTQSGDTININVNYLIGTRYD